MSAPTPTTPDAIHRALNTLTGWIHAGQSTLANALSSIGLSKPAAEVAAVAESALEAALPAALHAGQAALADSLTPEHLQALATLIGEINATVVKQFLARVPVAVAAAAVSTTV